MNRHRHYTGREIAWHLISLTLFTASLALWIYLAAPVSVR